MNGSKGLLDSNVIIDSSKNLIDIDDLTDRYDNLYTSIISYIEVLGYNFEDDEEKQLIIDILSNIPVVNLDINIAKIAIDFRKKRKIKLPDALILATAKYINADLVTRDISDFRNIDEDVNLVEPKLKE